MAEAYAKLIRNMWSGNFTTVVPKEFKQTLGKFAPQFAGYQQQDSQEFMSFLLDGIHEDLNRVQKKPYTEVVEGDGTKPDSQVAQEAWRRHLQRNDSVVVDRCQGLLRSHLTCPHCNHQSVTFDPYMSLSLPLISTPQSRRLQVRSQVPTPANSSGVSHVAIPSTPVGLLVHGIQVVFVGLPAGTEPKIVDVAVPNHGSVSDLAAAVAEKAGVRVDSLQVCDIYSNRIFKQLRWLQIHLLLRVSLRFMFP